MVTKCFHHLCVQQTFRFMTRLFSERCVLSDLKARRRWESGVMSERTMWSKFFPARSCLWKLKMVDMRSHHSLTVTLQGITRHYQSQHYPVLSSSSSVQTAVFTPARALMCAHGFFFSLPSLSIVGSLCEFQMLLTCLSAGKSVHLGCYYRLPVCDWSTKETFHCLLLDYKHVLIHP